jgi:hypothetical protein
MEQGGNAEARIIAKGLTDLMSDGTNEQVQAYINKNRSDLVEIAKIDDRMFDVVRLMLYGDEAVGAGGSQTMEEPLFGATAGAGATIEDSVAASPGYDPETGDYFPPERPLDQREALRAVGDSRFSDQDIATGFARYYGATEARNQAGTGLPPYLGVPPSSEQFDDTTAIFNQRIEPLRRLERRPEPWEFGGLGVDSPTPQGMAHGGVPRGTVAGELEPRGYLTARQAGETMRERAKGLRGRRNYGGGIGSLYNRYG